MNNPLKWKLLGPKEIGETEELPDGKFKAVVYCDYAIEMEPGGPGTIIAEVFGRCGEHTYPDAKKNALMMVAAPEMLQLIKKINAHLVRPDILGDLIDEAERLIAKAEGK